MWEERIERRRARVERNLSEVDISKPVAAPVPPKIENVRIIWPIDVRVVCEMRPNAGPLGGVVKHRFVMNPECKIRLCDVPKRHANYLLIVLLLIVVRKT